MWFFSLSLVSTGFYWNVPAHWSTQQRGNTQRRTFQKIGRYSAWTIFDHRDGCEYNGSETGQHQMKYNGRKFGLVTCSLANLQRCGHVLVKQKNQRKKKRADGMKAWLPIVYYSGMASFMFMQMDTMVSQKMRNCWRVKNTVICGYGVCEEYWCRSTLSQAIHNTNNTCL